jgi:hypothetical protein
VLFLLEQVPGFVSYSNMEIWYIGVMVELDKNDQLIALYIRGRIQFLFVARFDWASND